MKLHLTHSWRWAVLILLLSVALAYGGWLAIKPIGLPKDVAAGNGRIEAVDVDIATKLPGRVKAILVQEGDFVTTGQVLAEMDTAQLNAQYRQAEAELKRAIIEVQTAQSLVTQREAERMSDASLIAEREARLRAAQERLDRSENLAPHGGVSRQTLDDNRADVLAGRASVSAAEAEIAAANAAIGTARSQVAEREAAVDAAHAAIQTIKADIVDSTLTAPIDGRVQYRIAQPGEVLPAGGRILNLVNLRDVYMTFYLPTNQAGRVSLGSAARIVLDAVPNYVIPATVSFVSDVAQFTPKTVETADERQKLMFRIKARLPPALLKKYIREVKTGLPGVAYVRLDPKVPWPAFLNRDLLQ